MQPPNPALPQKIAEVLQTGRVLGENHTFALVSGRCSAAQADSLLRLRESKCYLPLASTWKEFCPRFLNISYSRADRIIRCLQEFGPSFFELQSLIAISPEVYRSIEPAIHDGALHVNDQAIQLDPENSRKVLAAVTELRRSLPPKEPPPPPTLEERLTDLDQRSKALIAEFISIALLECERQNKDRFEIVLNHASAALQRIEMDLGIF
jgi:hypothetical protein